MGSVRVLSPAHVDASLAVSQSDILVAGRLFDHPAQFLAVLEHRSSVEHRLALRLLRYSAEAWARESPRKGPLPDVIPIVVYAGRRPWTAPHDLAGLLAPTSHAALTALRPRFSYLLVDLPRLSNAELRARALGPLGALALFTLRAVQQGGLRAALSDLMPLVGALTHVHDGPAALVMLLSYLLAVVPTDERPLVHDVIAALPDPELEDAVKKVKTIADSLREEGEARARAEFAERLAEFEHLRKDVNARLRASVTKQLQLKYGPLPDAITARLATASADELDTVAERLLFADTLEAALGKR
jgi:hypothetical protein